MKRLTAFFVGSLLVFLVILSIMNLAFFLEATQCAEEGLAGINGAFFVDDLYAMLRKYLATLGLLALVHFVVSAVIGGVYWLCWRPTRRANVGAESVGDGASAELDVLTRGVFPSATSRNLSPFFAALFALVVLSPILNIMLGKTYRDMQEFLENKIARPLVDIAIEQHDEAESPEAILNVVAPTDVEEAVEPHISDSNE